MNTRYRILAITNSMKVFLSHVMMQERLLFGIVVAVPKHVSIIINAMKVHNMVVSSHPILSMCLEVVELIV